MVLLTITSAAKSAIELYDKLEGKPTRTPHVNDPSLKESQVGDPITHGQLIDIVEELRKRHGQNDTLDSLVTLDNLLKGARIYVPLPKPKPAPTSEYVALMARLRKAEEKQAYERMINPPPPQETNAQRFPGATTYGAAAAAKSPQIIEDDEATYADINRQMTLIINVLVTIIASSVTIWMAARHWSIPSRLALSMIGSIVIAVAEVGIYLGYIRRVTIAKSEEKKITEAKQVADTWVIEGRPTKGLASGVGTDSMRFRKGKHR